ncbi:hypothetical protein LLEC1_00634 [Akanthomyces lecanii]|uniref:Zn(2)-C6 fungal-type domain-containing protein n=1 Tax=Cordyceps confragosa TaxID=2714763 RepID=A0A179I4U6_CORDF|nr:hypothetical protein LLEC1_00634 [Akanthomyces lecanii]
MVNRGRSKGCITCKQRRVKCDETRPECGHCRRLGLRCGGYEIKCARRLKFKDQNHKFYNKTSKRQTSPCQELVHVSSPRNISEPDSAVAFYLGQYAGKGRETASARGFFEMLIPTYNAQPENSPLSLAVRATATKVLSLWRHGPRGLALPQTAYAEAVSRVRQAVQDEVERQNPATIMAIVALQLCESIAAVYNLRPATKVHQRGAASLLPYLKPSSSASVGEYIRRFVVHTEIASAIREKKPPGSEFVTSTARGSNPSSALDAIGAEVALLQASHAQLKDQIMAPVELANILSNRIQEAKRIDDKLLTWEQLVPEHWKPQRLSKDEFDSSIPAYQHACETYPSCQIATIWNFWRVQRLILAAIAADSQNRLRIYNAETPCVQTHERALAQELVDGICYSVPFYLGNRSRPMSLRDFTDNSILYPSDSMLHLDTSHIIAQGPWNILSPLSRLLALFSDESEHFFAALLRTGQITWIREQFLRVTILIHVAFALGKQYSPDRCALVGQYTEEETDKLMKLVRSGLRFASGS